MARMTVFTNSILPCQEAFLVDAPTPEASPRRWIQAKRAGGGGSLPPLTKPGHGSKIWEVLPMTSLKRSDRRNRERTPSREEMDADVSIPARFEKVMLAVTDGCGTRSRGHHSV